MVDGVDGVDSLRLGFLCCSFRRQSESQTEKLQTQGPGCDDDDDERPRELNGVLIDSFE